MKFVDWAAGVIFGGLAIGVAAGVLTNRWATMSPRAKWALLGIAVASGLVVVAGVTRDDEQRGLQGDAAALDKCSRSYSDSGPSPMTLDVVVQDPASGCFEPVGGTFEPGSVVLIAMRYENRSTDRQDRVALRVDSTGGLDLVPGTTEYINDGTDGWDAVETDDITDGGISLGNYAPGAAVYVRFKVAVPQDLDLTCGLSDRTVEAVAFAEGDGTTTSGSTRLSVFRPC